MDAPPPPSSSSPSPPVEATETTTPQTEAPPQPPAVSDPPPPSTPAPTADSSQNPNPSSQSKPQESIPQPRPPIPAARPAGTPFPHFAHHLPSSAAPRPAVASSQTQPMASNLSASTSATMPRGGGVALGVPAHASLVNRPPQSPVTFSSFGASQTFSQPFSSLSRPGDQSTTTAQARPAMQNIQSIGMMGSVSNTSQMRPGGALNPQQQRFNQPLSRAISPSAGQTISTQKFTGSGFLRTPMVSPGSSSQQQQVPALHGKQLQATSTPLSSYRPTPRPHILQPRSILPQQQHSLPTASQQTSSSQQQQKQYQPFHLQQLPQQQQPPSSQQQQSSLSHSQDQHTQHNIQVRNNQSLQQPSRPPGPTGIRSNAPTMLPSTMPQPGTKVSMGAKDGSESGNRVISKRSISELFSQIDPSEKLDSEVEDVLIDVAEDFIESVTTFACSLAKHRKSATLEARDILLHVERNWNIALPGFGGDEIKCYKKQITNDIHRERLAVIKKSMATTGDGAGTKNPVSGQTANVKAHATKVPPIGSPKP